MQDSLAQGRILHYTEAVQYADTSIIGLFLSAGSVSCSDRVDGYLGGAYNEGERHGRERSHSQPRSERLPAGIHRLNN